MNGTDPTVAAGVQFAALILTTVQQYQAGQLTEEQVKAQWSEAVQRVAGANAAWDAAGGLSK